MCDSAGTSDPAAMWLALKVLDEKWAVRENE